MPEGPPNSKVFGKSGGFEKLVSYQVGELLYDFTVRFTKKFIEPGSRTRDQMDQAARSGSRNIAEGSVFSATYSRRSAVPSALFPFGLRPFHQSAYCSGYVRTNLPKAAGARQRRISVRTLGTHKPPTGRTRAPGYCYVRAWKTERGLGQKLDQTLEPSMIWLQMKQPDSQAPNGERWQWHSVSAL
ncbi:MAG: four helix bundle protein [Bacteroidetes bacterium]|nr:four helix bundle protein [Bacteroidota bacterium]